MPQTTPVPPNKRKKANKIITDLSNVTQDDDDESDPEAAELDLGTKIKTPKDTMLEELSLLNNKGSKMFQLRQQRVEKFIVTNQNMQNLEDLLMSPPPTLPKPQMPKTEVVVEIVDLEAEKKRRRREYIRTYVSPWERAMKGDRELTATMKGCMPGPIEGHSDMLHYKSFNRTALPFGGFDKVCKLLPFEIPEINVESDEPEPLPSLQADIRSRPSFNRTPIGWVCSEENSQIHMDLDHMPFDGETDDL
ncbi:myozenin-1b [Genypterus blacodes]|uniref:myozenin-1b n=1 Tax=Genypterus blacodes TaxID=154954 RepID=UPI003F76A75F